MGGPHGGPQGGPGAWASRTHGPQGPRAQGHGPQGPRPQGPVGGPIFKTTKHGLKPDTKPRGLIGGALIHMK